MDSRRINICFFTLIHEFYEPINLAHVVAWGVSYVVLSSVSRTRTKNKCLNRPRKFIAWPWPWACAYIMGNKILSRRSNALMSLFLDSNILTLDIKCFSLETPEISRKIELYIYSILIHYSFYIHTWYIFCLNV